MFALILSKYTLFAQEYRKASFGAFLLLFLAGCSTNPNSGAQDTPWIIKSDQQTTNNSHDRKWQVEIEEDGLPSQVPPQLRIRSLPDDPSEPWSTNYGKEMKEALSLRDKNISQNYSHADQD